MRGVRLIIYNLLLVSGLQLEPTIERMAKYSSKAYMSTKDAKINTLIDLPENIGIRALLIMRIYYTCRGTCNIADE